ncbi:transcriptional regulator [Oceaniradius stylonematis]|uniref:transcriptional regulator n=1 Tax=Oceaniradius stylonematis TaxID=2184161 RepID=UPI00273F4F59|nr:transcriptional regulator [Oceaniradius stylonematis]
MAVFSGTDKQAMKRPHVGRSFFVELEFPDGTRRYHNGVGRVTVGGHDWLGVEDPIGGMMVGISEVEDPRFGTAAAIEITLAGLTYEFVKSVRSISRDLEGRAAEVYWAMFDPETQTPIVSLTKLFPGGSITAPRWEGSLLERKITLTIESVFDAENFPLGTTWSDIAQQQRYAGDRGLEFMGREILTTRK